MATKTYYDTLASVASAADSDIIVIQTDTVSNLSTMKKTTVGALRQPLVDQIAAGSMAASEAGKFISGINVDESGHVSVDLTAFKTTIDSASGANGNVAPTAEAVRSFVVLETNTGVISEKIATEISKLTAASVGGNGKYISQISEEGGKISATEKSLETDINNNSQNAPTSSAVKSYVDSKIQGLTGSIGGASTLVKSVSEVGGKITGESIAIDSTLSSSASAIPTSKAVNDKIQGLTGSIGGNSTLVKSVTETDGKITGQTITIDQTVAYANTGIPTSSAVKTAIDSQVQTQINALDRDTGDLSSGATGKYFTRIIETDGAISACSVDLVTYGYTGGTAAGTWSTGVNNKYPISASAAKNYTDYKAAVINDRIDKLDYVHASATTGAGDGWFINKVTQTDGKIATEKTAFENNTLASYGSSAETSSFASSTKTAPTVRAVTEQIDYLNRRIDAANGSMAAMSTGPLGETGAYIEIVAQAGGFIQASSKAFLTSIPPTTGLETHTGASVPATASAVRLAINALNKPESGGAGKYIRAIKEDTGVIAATPISFDTTIGPSTGASHATDNNAPTSLAVRTAIDKAKKEILEQSEAMTYMNAVNSTTGMKTALEAKRGPGASFDSGDTFVADGPFNLNNSAETTYAVYPGDMIISKSSSVPTATGAVDPTKFDIVSGNQESVMSAATTASSGLIAIFNSDNRRIITASTETITTLAERQAAAAKSAASAASAAACSASAAIFADNGIQPYIADAASAASCSASSASQAEFFRSCSASSASKAEFMRSCSASAANISENKRKDSASAASCSASSASQAEFFRSCSASSASKAEFFRSCSASAASKAEFFRSCSASSASKAEFFRSCSASSASQAEFFRSCSASSASKAEFFRSCSASSASKAEFMRSCSASAADVAEFMRSCSASAADVAEFMRSCSASAADVAEFFRSCSASSASKAEFMRSCSASAADKADIALSDTTGYKQSAYTAMTAALDFASSTTLYYILNGATAASKAASISAACSASSAEISSTAAASALSSAINHSNSYFIHNSSYASATASEVQTIKGNLSVNNLTATNMVQASGVLANVLTANTINQNSSRKVKENITPAIISALDLVDTVDIVNYNYINDDEKTQKIGFIAEDTDRLLSTPHQNAMDYGNCIGVLLKAVQEITKGMEKLEKRIEKME